MSMTNHFLSFGNVDEYTNLHAALSSHDFSRDPEETMNETKARAVLAEKVQIDNTLFEKRGKGMVHCAVPNNQQAFIHGVVDTNFLKALLWWMENKL